MVKVQQRARQIINPVASGYEALILIPSQRQQQYQRLWSPRAYPA